MRYLFMDNQPNNQNPIKPNPSDPNPIIPENPIPESQIPVTTENPIATMTGVPASETELPSSQPEPQPESQPEPEIKETVPVGDYQNEYQDVLDQYKTSQETTEMTPENETLTPSTSTITDSDIFPKPPQNNLFKIIFIISLIIFVLTSTVLAFTYFKNQNSSLTTNNQSSTVNNLAPTVSPDTCFLNDKTYQAGETFTATDGCNTCTCVSQNNISCTDKECSSSKSATISTTTNNSAPTTVTDETQDWQTYTNSTFNYSIKYPKNWSIIQGHTYAADDSESIKNKSIEIIDNNQKTVMQIYIDSKSQIGNITLNEFAKQITPLDKTKVSNITNYKVNTFDGVSALVEFTDKVPGLQSGLRYFIKNNNYYVTFSTEESKISANISNILSTFKFN